MLLTSTFLIGLKAEHLTGRDTPQMREMLESIDFMKPVAYLLQI